jgi:ubiquinone/menaquinone biosynthesis C-methylase UbiE
VKHQAQWVPDTRFGSWFQRTSIWRRYVVEPALDELQRLLLAHSDGKSLERILDVGCGAGVAFAGLEARFHPRQITAVEIDPAMLAAARAAAARCASTVEVVHADAQDLALADAAFDAVFCHQTLHHLCRQSQALQGFRRLLRPGGVLLLAESCGRFTRSLAVRALFRHPPSGHRRSGEYLRLLREAGFEIGEKSISTPDPFWARADFGAIERITGRRSAPAEPAQLNVVARRGTRT